CGGVDHRGGGASRAGRDSLHDVAPSAWPPAEPERRPRVPDAMACCLYCGHLSSLRHAAARSAALTMNRSGSSAIACPMNVATPGERKICAAAEHRDPRARDTEPGGDVGSDYELRPRVDEHGSRLTQIKPYHKRGQR